MQSFNQMHTRSQTARNTSCPKPLKQKIATPKIEFFFEDEDQDNQCGVSPAEKVHICKEEQLDFSFGEIKELHTQAAVKSDQFSELQADDQASYEPQQFEIIQQSEAYSTNSKASTVRKQPTYNEFGDQDFSDFSYQEDYRVYEDFSQQELQSFRRKKAPINDEAARREARRKRGAERKVRTTITTQKLEELNILFKQHFDYKSRGLRPILSLKGIAQKVGLSHSTTLHKASIFKKNQVVKPGKFLSSLTKKRKYKKSEECQRYIALSLRERPFYSAEALAKFIHRKFHISYPRAVIGRHLSQMGYSSNNIKAYPLEKNGAKCIEMRRQYAQILNRELQSSNFIVYVDEVAFSKNLFRSKTTYTPFELKRQMLETEKDYVSVMIAMSSDSVIYYDIREGFYQKQDFVNAVGFVYSNSETELYKRGYHKIILVNDLHKIHYDNPKIEKLSERNSIEAKLSNLGIRRFFLPPGSPQLNPVEIMVAYLKNLLLDVKDKITDCTILKEKISEYMQVIARESTNRFFFEFKKWFTKALEGEAF